MYDFVHNIVFWKRHKMLLLSSIFNGLQSTNNWKIDEMEKIKIWNQWKFTLIHGSGVLEKKFFFAVYWTGQQTV